MNWKHLQIEYNLFISLTSIKVKEIIKINPNTRFNIPKLRLGWKRGLFMKIII